MRTGLPLQESFFVLDRNLRAERTALSEIIKTYRKIYLDEGAPLTKPFVGVRDTLQDIHARGTKCVVVSNKGIGAIRQSLDQSQLSPFVDLVFGDEPGLPKKPDPAIVVNHILPRYAPLRREQMLVVGDTEIDILLAKRTGIACCWVSYGYGDTDRCRALKPDHEISSIEELPALVAL